MTRYEKCVFLFLLLFLGLKIINISGASAAYFFAIWILALSYLVGGHQLFYRESTTKIVKIIAGVAFATAIISFENTSSVETDTLYKILPAVNAIFWIWLGYYASLKRSETGFAIPYGLWLRSSLLLSISSFFAYCPISFWPYRKALIALNQNRATIVSNLRMFDYREKYDAAMDRKDYFAAITYGQQAITMGKRWLAADSVRLRWKISGTYSNLYEAYKGLGESEYSRRKYSQALRAYRIGNDFLVTGDHRKNGTERISEYWEEEKAWSLNNLAFCYLKLRRFKEGDSLFIAAVKAYKKVYPTPDVYSASLTGDVATSFTAQRQFEAANRILLNIDRFLANDTTRKAASMRAANAMDISLNYIQQDSLMKALCALQTITYPKGDTTASRYKAKLQEAICLYKLGQYNTVEKALQQPLAYYERRIRYWEAAALCDVMLAKNSLSLASYSKSQGYINAARAILLAKNQGNTSSLNGNCFNVLGTLNKALGNYKIADQQLAQAVKLMRQDEDNYSGTLSETLAQLTDLDILMGREQAAHEHVSNALALLLQGKPVTLPSQTGVLAVAAYVDYVQGHYVESSRKYRQAIAINTRFRQGQNGNTAAAWNGLGLVEIAQRHYERADSILQQAQQLHERVFTKRHPLTANVYLNYGLLRLKQNRNQEAALFFNKARTIAQTFLPADHDMFADLAMAMGDLATQEKQAATAHGYYKQALAIYIHKFPASHWKVKAAEQKIGA